MVDVSNPAKLALIDKDGDTLSIDSQGIHFASANCSPKIDIFVSNFYQQLNTLTNSTCINSTENPSDEENELSRALTDRRLETRQDRSFNATLQLRDQCGNPVRTDLPVTVAFGGEICVVSPTGQGSFAARCNYPIIENDSPPCETSVRRTLTHLTSGSFTGVCPSIPSVWGLISRQLGSIVNSDELLRLLRQQGSDNDSDILSAVKEFLGLYDDTTSTFGNSTSDGRSGFQDMVDAYGVSMITAQVCRSLASSTAVNLTFTAGAATTPLLLAQLTRIPESIPVYERNVTDSSAPACCPRPQKCNIASQPPYYPLEAKISGSDCLCGTKAEGGGIAFRTKTCPPRTSQCRLKIESSGYSNRLLADRPNASASVTQSAMTTSSPNDDSRCVNVFKSDVDHVAQKDRNYVCAPDTGNWFFHYPEYESFQTASEPRMLLVTAEAGGGKSTAMRTLVDNLQASSKSPLVAYFFFKDDDDRLRSYQEALSSLVHQLLVQDRELSQPQDNVPHWEAEDGYELIDAFHVAFGEHHLTSINQAVKAMEKGDKDRGSMLSNPLGWNSGSVSSNLEDLAWNPVMVALQAKAYVTTAILLAYGANLTFELPKRRRARFNKFRIRISGLTPLHLAVGGNDRHGWSSTEIGLSSGGYSKGCSFAAVANPDYPVSKMSPMEMLAKRQNEDHARYRAEEFKSESSDSEFEMQRFAFANDSTGAEKVPFDSLFGLKFTSKTPCHSLLESVISNLQASTDRQETLVLYMLRNGASVNARTVENITPLIASVEAGNLKIVKVLLDHGADPNISGAGGGTPLMIAANNGRRDLVEVLLASGASPNAQTDQVTPDRCACASFVKKSSFIFDRCHAPLTALVVATERGHVDVVETLLASGADVNLRIVHHAHGRLPFKKKRSKLYPPSSSDSESEPEAERWEGYISVGTALTWARDGIRDLLLRHGADPGVEEPIRRCGCQVIERRTLNTNSDDEYPRHEESDSGVEFPWRRRRHKVKRQMVDKSSSDES
ncbi:Ankyrin repeat and SOCS box protein 2 [Colletotrichum trifolii]|uniref:Ankyrin repeat and SOCS box protein 2 n=1 Tax=Colletotrichum trifolii TaxID=5466 RepID=A0A4R8RGK8_COLTR|nr:Ankyrin repeat and SOCS box protein 2 [Colletotrichum trifolii]